MNRGGALNEVVSFSTPELAHVRLRFTLFCPTPSNIFFNPPEPKVETLNEALKIAAMDIAAAGVSPDMDMGNGEKVPKRSQAPVDADTGSSTSSGESAGSAEPVGGPDRAETQKRQQQRQQQQASLSSGTTANRIFVFQDGTFQAR